jgi:hypothetical protein
MSLSKETARRLINELKYARQELAVLRAIADTVNVFRAALDAEPRRHGMGTDIVGQAEQELETDNTQGATA